MRTGAGLFDVSHMGEFEVTGPDRNAFVNYHPQRRRRARLGRRSVLGDLNAGRHHHRRLHWSIASMTRS